jgi:hypothetical protein
VSGVLPDGTYDGNTRIYLCCRGDDTSNIKASWGVPVGQPVVLYSSFATACVSPQLPGFVGYDSEDSANENSFTGVCPTNIGAYPGMTYSYCTRVRYRVVGVHRWLRSRTDPACAMAAGMRHRQLLRW